MLQKLIIGIGNPGKKYENIYHNVGHLFIDYLNENQQNSQFPITNYQLLKSDVYMNESGRFVAKLLRKNNIKTDELVVAHDDSDIELGKYKISFNKSSAGHKGVESIIKNINSQKFWRIRIGIRPPAKEGIVRKKAEEFVLKKITTANKKIIQETFKSIAANLAVI